MMLYKMFIKLYRTVGEITTFEGIIALEPPKNSSEGIDFVGDLEFMIEDDLSFQFTTLETYMNYRLNQDMGGMIPFKDLQTQNISC